VPPLIFSGKPMKRKRPLPTSSSMFIEVFHMGEAQIAARSRETDEEIQRLNELSAAMAGFAALPNNSSLPLGHLRAIARSGIFDGLRLCRREAFADLLGAARGTKRRLRVTLELRHHLACDQFVAAHCC